MPEIKIRNAKDLEKVLKLIAKNALEDTGEKLVEDVKGSVDKVVYEPYEPSYERTYELRDKISSKDAIENGNDIEVEISHDIDEMSYNTNKYQHGSKYWEPEDYREYTPYTVHEGLSGTLFGDKGYWRTPRRYMTHAKEKIESEKKHIKIMKQKLNEKGIKTE